MYCFLAALLAMSALARADEDALPPPPPPTAPDSIIPTTPISPLEPPMEPPPKSPDRLPPSGSLPSMGTLAPEDIPNPPVLSPTSPETPDTTEPGTPAPESPTKKAEVEELPSPPPPIAAETEVKPSKDLDKMLAPTDPSKDENGELPPPAPFEETPEVAETKEEPKEVPREEPRPQAEPESETRTARMSVSERARLRHIPQYQKIKPQWAFQFTYSPNALGNGDIADANEGAKATGEQLSIEFQPRFLQSAGVIGFGPTLSIYPVSKTFNVTSSDFAIWAVGAQVRYQARFFREQPLVPVAGFAWERLTYRLSNLGPTGATRDANGAIDVTGPFFGLWFLLNILEPNQASVGYLNSGLVRSYLVAELRSMTGSDDDVDVSGNSYFFGLRIEF